MFKYRLYPNSKQIAKIEDNLRHCKEAWNTLLGLNKKLLTTNKYDFNGLILDMKRCYPPIGKATHSQVLQNVSDRLHKSFNAFFSRSKQRKQGINVRAGYPRFKSRVRSMTYPQGGFKLVDNKLSLSKIGRVPIVLSRPIKGRIKTLTIKKNAVGQWFAIFSCTIDQGTPKHPSKKTVGIDVGLEQFAVLSKEDTAVFNPRFFAHAQKRLAREQRKFSRRVKGSKNREKQRIKVAKVHLKIFNRRTDFLHKVSSRIAKAYKICKTEHLNIKNMLQNHKLAKSISDAGWGRFFQMLSYKEVILGGEHHRVNPAYTSQKCSSCGALVSMPLNKRRFTCRCGLNLHRDKNSALVIEQRHDTVGLTGISTSVDRRPLQQPFVAVASHLDEAETICVNEVEK